MGHCHALGRVSDQVAGHKGIFHSDVSHRDTVADRDRRKFSRHAACHRHAQLDCLCDLVEVHMSRYYFIIRIHDSDQRPLHFLLCHAERMEQRPVRRLLDSFFYCITSHSKFPPCIESSRLCICLTRGPRSGCPFRQYRLSDSRRKKYLRCGILLSAPVLPHSLPHPPPRRGRGNNAAS